MKADVKAFHTSAWTLLFSLSFISLHYGISGVETSSSDQNMEVASRNTTHAGRLLRELFGTTMERLEGRAEYDPRVRPSSADSDTTKVSVVIYIKSVTELNVAEEVLRFTMYSQYIWYDRGVRWNPAAYGGLTNYSLENHGKDLIWWPRYEIYQSVRPPYKEMGLEKPGYRIKWTGEVTMLDVRANEVSCGLAFADFPFDKQSCTIEVYSPTLEMEAMAFKTVDLDPGSRLVKNTAHKITDIRVANFFSCLTTDGTQSRVESVVPGQTCFSMYSVTIDFERHPEPYVTLSIVPVAFVTFLTFLSFLLPVKTGERIGLIITALLTVAAVMFITSEKLPDSKETTILNRFNKLMILLTLIVMLEASIVNFLHDFELEVDIKTSRLIVMYPELWMGRLVALVKKKMQLFRPRVDPDLPDGDVDEEMSNIRNDCSVQKLKASKGHAWRHTNNSRRISMYSFELLSDILHVVDLKHIIPKLLEQNLMDLELLRETTPQLLISELGLTLGDALMLSRCIKSKHHSHKLYPLSDILDRMSIIVFPIVWFILIAHTLGGHISLDKIIFGLVA
ncbi:hypothetical protein CYMTET_35237 [Cymbomonas tetramitiformis]|uniref:Uncharacterized protein n=1 Tax=Cymbomonas tetramitiformis TaxID=36881 RepID=A0AAE0F9I2_9CHLO|nr:hypothetical protein CYMTET_35237 [Cymbomonas tetramitiformis]